jgi:hypothetical protein
MITSLNDLKKQVFFDMLKLAGRVYVLVRYSENVVIGKRGFLPEERERGIILVFNDRMDFDWDLAGISATLNFGAAFEKCFIPPDDILTIFSPDLSAQFSVSPEKNEKTHGKQDETKEEKSPDGKVVRVDFNRKDKK